MMEGFSANTQAILLLTAPLIDGRAKVSPDLLTPGEYNKLAQRLRESEGQPADLLGQDAESLLADCSRVVDRSRLERLLARGFVLSQAVERWQARALWVVSRADEAYPERLKTRLRESSPAILYGCGERAILDSGGLAVVGSRHVDEALIAYTEEIGRRAASARQTLVSGGARGIDQAAMRGALEAGGRVAGVLSDSLERTATNREHRNLLLDDRLVLVSPYDPSAGFNVGHAMQRNKLIYALADAALVVNAEVGKGGTWAGATEQVERLHLVPVYVRSTGTPSEGLEALRRKGALAWPNPEDAQGLVKALSAQAVAAFPPPSQSELSFSPREEPMGPKPTQRPGERDSKPANRAAKVIDPSAPDPADELFRTVRSLVQAVVREPKKPAEVASGLGVTRKQAEEWLARLVEEGVLEKRKKPIRYAVRQASLLDS